MEVLYHGSRTGINGNIIFNHPLMGTNRDFGKGFYMGTNPLQVKTLIIRGECPTFYELKLKLSEIPEEKILKLDGKRWAYFVLCNRNKLKEINPQITKTEFYNYFSNLSKGKIISSNQKDSYKNFVTVFF